MSGSNLFQLATLLLFAATTSADSVILPGDRVVLLGDQFAVELASRESIVSAIEAAGASVEGHGLCGAEAAGFPLPEGLARDDMVILCLGMIDSFRGDSHLDRFKVELKSIVNQLPGNQIILVTPVPREIEIGDDQIEVSNHAVVVGLYADAVRTVASEHDLLCVDLHGPLMHAHSQRGISRDGLHLDVNGWDFAEQEILWTLGMRDQPPSLWLEDNRSEKAKALEDMLNDLGTLEQDMSQGRVDLPPLPGSSKVDSSGEEPPGMNWDTALEHVQDVARAEESPEPTSLRTSMDFMVREPGRSEDALTILAEIADNENMAMDVRLAAMAAIDDLPGGFADDRAGIQTIRIMAVPVKMTYDPNRFDVVAGEPVRILLDNPDAQPHNLLVCKPGSLRSIGRAAEALGTTAEAQARDWVPDSPRILHVMPMVMQGETGEVRFIAPTRPGRYPIICTYPGHWRMMNGVMTVRRVGQ